MLENYRIRTDLALETTERIQRGQRGDSWCGYSRELRSRKNDIRTTVVKIETENGAKAMGRPRHLYYN